jgi:hypothetical protein
VLEAAENGQPLADGVGARAEPFVGQGLPGWEVGDPVWVEEAAERGDEVLGLARGGSDGEDRTAGGAHERGDQLGAGARGGRQVDGELPLAGHVEGTRDAGIGGERGEQGGERHAVGLPGAGWTLNSTKAPHP